MIELDYTLWIQMANFLVLMFLLHLLAYKPVLSLLDKREQHLKDLDGEVKSLEAEVDRKVEKYEEQLRDARQEAISQRSEIQQEGAGEGKAIIDKARGEVQRIVEDFKKKANEEMTDARNVLRSHAEKISVDISEKVLGRSIQ